jgi:hypothetical protein
LFSVFIVICSYLFYHKKELASSFLPIKKELASSFLPNGSKKHKKRTVALTDD